jgi:hypothetical protein
VKKSRGLSFGGGGESRKLERQASNFYEPPLYEEEELMGYGAPPMPKRSVVVTSKGDITATFSIPGLITIPSDGVSHNVTITELELDAEMSWVSVPKKSAKAHLTVRSLPFLPWLVFNWVQAKIKNESEYTFLSGIASVYVDGSFISRSDVPAVSPQESFDCPLG